MKWEKELLPVVVQDFYSKEVLMLAYMNEAAYDKTMTDQTLCFYSRSRRGLWIKGETSGHRQDLISLKYDCDKDALLALVVQKGPACHTGHMTCFHNNLIEKSYSNFSLQKLLNRISDRKLNPIEGSYTNYLLDKGQEKILKKISEEAGEVVIAAMKENKEELINELCDLIYHSLVLMVDKEISISQIIEELAKRFA